MKISWWQRLIMAAMNKAPGNGEGVKPLQTKLVQIDPIGLGGQLLPERPCHRLRCILYEIVAPDFPRNQHRIIGTRCRQLIKQGYVIRWQLIEDAVTVLNDERIQKDHPPDPVGKFFGYFLDY